MSPGRPSDYTDEIAEEICDRLSAGEPLAQICRDDHMPSLRTVYNWRDANDEFSARIACAREAGFDQIAMDALHIADDTRHDTRYGGAEGEERELANTEWITRSRLRVETRLKLLAKWDPKRYGEATMLKHADADGGKLDLADRMARAEANFLAGANAGEG